MQRKTRRWRGGSRALVAAAIVSIAAAGAVAPIAGAQGIAGDGVCTGDLALSQSLAQADPLEPLDPADASTLKPDVDELAGKWRKLPPSPFGSASGVGVWTGLEMIVSDSKTGKTAGFDPDAQAWTRYAKAPLSMKGATATWTGEEMIVLARRTAGGVHGMAFDPAAASWRELPAAPEALQNPADSIWTGAAVVVASSGPHELPSSEVPQAAAYYPAGDCWLLLPEVAGEPQLRSLYATEYGVLAVTGNSDSDVGIVVSMIDSTEGPWSIASESGLVDDGDTAVWTDDELVFLSREPNDAELRSAAYDPATDSWRALDLDCEVATDYDPVWTGQLIVTQWRWAVDPDADACLKLPKRRDRSRGTPVRVWAGDRVIEWSGSQGDLPKALPDGIQYRPR